MFSNYYQEIKIALYNTWLIILNILTLMNEKKKKLLYVIKNIWKANQEIALLKIRIEINSTRFTRLKNKFENNSTSEVAFYQSEWVKITSSLGFFRCFIYFMCVAELFCMTY